MSQETTHFKPILNSEHETTQSQSTAFRPPRTTSTSDPTPSSTSPASTITPASNHDDIKVVVQNCVQEGKRIECLLLCINYLFFVLKALKPYMEKIDKAVGELLK